MATGDGSEDLFDFIYGDLAVETTKKVAEEPTDVASSDVQTLLARIYTLQSANEELVKIRDKQSLLLSSLLETARAEIKRKNLLIADLKRNIEDITFRRACATGTRKEFEDVFRKTHESSHDTKNEKAFPESGSSHLPGLGTFEVSSLGDRRVQTVVVGNTSFTNIVYGDDLDPKRTIRLDRNDKVENRKRRHEERSPAIAAKKSKTGGHLENGANGKVAAKESSSIRKRHDSERRDREAQERKERDPDRSARTRSHSRSNEREREERRRLRRESGNKERDETRGKSQRNISEKDSNRNSGRTGTNSNEASAFRNKDQREDKDSKKSGSEKPKSAKTAKDITEGFSSVTRDEIDDMNTVDLEALIKHKAEHLAHLRQEEEKCKKMIAINNKGKSNKKAKGGGCPKGTT